MAESVTAPMVGKVFQVNCKVGEKVEEEQIIIVLEAMKMEIPVMAPCAGTIKEIKIAVGDTVESDTVLAVIE
jgi:biotin carboxyl carrier protein